VVLDPVVVVVLVAVVVVTLVVVVPEPESVELKVEPRGPTLMFEKTT
jgi:hypothetical protein